MAHSTSSEVWTIISAHLKNTFFHEFEPQLVVMVFPFKKYFSIVKEQWLGIDNLQKWRHKWLSDSNVNNNSLKWNLTFSLKLQCQATLSFQRSRRLRAHWSSATAYFFHSLVICSLLETEEISVMVKFCRDEFDNIYQNTLVFNRQFGACIFCSYMNIDAKMHL